MGKCKHNSMDCPECHGGMMAEGGDVDGDDLVLKIMAKRYSKPAVVANDSQPIAGGESAEFDDLVKRDDLEFSYTGKNSGDDLGNEQQDEDREDIVNRVMKSRSKKDKNPKPA